jgi:hypothetical protein
LIIDRGVEDSSIAFGWVMPADQVLQRPALKDLSNTKMHTSSSEKAKSKDVHTSATIITKPPGDDKESTTAASKSPPAPLCEGHQTKARLFISKKEGSSEVKKYWLCAEGNIHCKFDENSLCL